LGEVIKEVMPLIAPFVPVVMEYFKTSKRIDPYEEQQRIEERIERERQRMIEQEERFEKKANEMLREKLEAYIPPKESSFVDRIGNILETATSVVLQNPQTAKILSGSLAIKKPIKTLQLHEQKQITSEASQSEAVPAKAEPIEPGSEHEKELLVNFVQRKILGGMDMVQLGEYIKKNPKILDRFARHSKNVLVAKAKVMIDLDQGTWGLIEEQLDKLYVFILGEQTTTIEPVEGESKPSEVLQVQA
jgi:isoleucyl-tRNA synthetase